MLLVLRGGGDRAFRGWRPEGAFVCCGTRSPARSPWPAAAELSNRLVMFPAPVIAALNGHAIGGGAEVAVAADIRVAASDVTIAFAQVRLAIMPAWRGRAACRRPRGPQPGRRRRSAPAARSTRRRRSGSASSTRSRRATVRRGLGRDRARVRRHARPVRRARSGAWSRCGRTTTRRSPTTRCATSRACGSRTSTGRRPSDEPAHPSS